MIEVIVDQTGDRAEAPDPEAAVVAARTMCDDITRTGLVVQGAPQLTCTFLVDGAVVRQSVPVRSMWALGRLA